MNYSHAITLLHADESIRKTIRVVEYFKTKHGHFMLEALSTQNIMVFKNIVLSNNKKINYFNPIINL